MKTKKYFSLILAFALILSSFAVYAVPSPGSDATTSITTIGGRSMLGLGVMQPGETKYKITTYPDNAVTDTISFTKPLGTSIKIFYRPYTYGSTDFYSFKLIANDDTISYYKIQQAVSGSRSPDYVYDISTHKQVIAWNRPIVAISPASQKFSAPFNVTLTETTNDFENASIYYTTDGSEPTSSSTLYTGPFEVSGNADVVVKAIAVQPAVNGEITSAVATETYQTNYSPVLSLTAALNVYVEVGTNPDSPSYIATDVEDDRSTTDGKTIGPLIADGTININVVGIYPVRYTVLDSDGNVSNTVVRNYYMVSTPVDPPDIIIDDIETPLGGTFAPFVVGYEDQTFRPTNYVTRGEVAAMLTRMLDDTPIPGESGFSDVEATDWYTPFINLAVATGIMEAYDDNTFKPDEPITRADLVKALAQFLVYKPLVDDLKDEADRKTIVDAPFTDIASLPIKSAINKLYTHGIIDGFPDNTFRPNEGTQRDQVAKMINIATNRIEHVPSAGPSYTDVSSDYWAYGHIEAASKVITYDVIDFIPVNHVYTSLVE